MHKVYLGLGSNQGDRTANLERAITLVGERVGSVLRQSSFIETEPWGFHSENLFLNAVILVETTLSPRELLLATQKIEREMGRKKSKWGQSPSATSRTDGTVPRRYADRPIDIDILLYDDLHIDEPDLKIPHPLMTEREFVMKPLKEIQETINNSQETINNKQTK